MQSDQWSTDVFQQILCNDVILWPQRELGFFSPGRRAKKCRQRQHTLYFVAPFREW
jgi:hypothetical protein